VLDTKSPKYLEMAQGLISLSMRTRTTMWSRSRARGILSSIAASTASSMFMTTGKEIVLR
jgi:hypothetical protein